MYYLAWYLCIFFAARGESWLSTVIVLICVVVQIFWLYSVQKRTHGLWLLSGLIAGAGTVIDSLLVMSGLVNYAANPREPFIAPWIIALWISFAVNLYTLPDLVFERLTWLGLASFGGFALAYKYGAFMGAVFFPYGDETCFLIGFIWLMVLPSTVLWYKKLMEFT